MFFAFFSKNLMFFKQPSQEISTILKAYGYTRHEIKS